MKRVISTVIAVTLCMSGTLTRAADDVLSFGVINQRSLALTAEYWNPILDYVGRKSGVTLKLRMGKTAPETTNMTLNGEHAFAYTNHLFTPERAALGMRVIARPDTPPINAAIVTPEDCPINALAELNGRTVAFPSKEAFVGYWVPMDHLLKSRVNVDATFAGNQEGAVSRMQHDRNVVAAAVNEGVLAGYAKRENFRYRVLWRSESYQDIPIMAHPSVPTEVVERVTAALVGMINDSEGRALLTASARVIGKETPTGFIPSNNDDFANYTRFYRETAVTN